MPDIPDGYAHLLDQPVYGHLRHGETRRQPAGEPDVVRMGRRAVAVHAHQKRQKYRNIEANPYVSMSIIDPENPYRYLEIRGVVDEIVPDPTGVFYLELNDRYSGPLTEPPPDKADRVILVVRPTGYTKQ